MKRVQNRTETWTVADLTERQPEIYFPTYKRRSAWSLFNKQMLIDSMVRGLDIGTLYFIERPDGLLDCLDGYNRIQAITSFLGLNTFDDDNNFPVRVDQFAYREPDVNKSIKDEGSRLLEEFTGKMYKDIFRKVPSYKNNLASRFVMRVLETEICMVVLSDIKSPQELRFQVSRGNLGTLINTGENVRFMLGDAREACFAEDGIGNHAFLKGAELSHVKYSSQKLAAEILTQIFYRVEHRAWLHNHHYNAQHFIAQHSKMNEDQQGLLTKVTALFDLLEEPFRGSTALKDHDLLLSIVLTAWVIGIDSDHEALQLAHFAEYLSKRMQKIARRQVPINRHKSDVAIQRSLANAPDRREHITYRIGLLHEMFEAWKPRLQQQVS